MSASGLSQSNRLLISPIRSAGICAAGTPFSTRYRTGFFIARIQPHSIATFGLSLGLNRSSTIAIPRAQPSIWHSTFSQRFSCSLVAAANCGSDLSVEHVQSLGPVGGIQVASIPLLARPIQFGLLARKRENELQCLFIAAHYPSPRLRRWTTPTWTCDHLRPLAVLTPRRFSSVSMALRLLMPADCSS